MPSRDKVAELAGVSVATVSRFFNDRSKIAESTAQRILDVVQRLDYHPNALGRSLSSKKSRIVGFIISSTASHESPYFSTITRGIEEALAKRGYHLLFYTADEKSTYMQMLKSKLVDGIILWGTPGDDEAIEELRMGNSCFVLINRYIETPGVCCVASDNMQGGYDATEHLIKNGHTRIGFLKTSDSLSIIERLQGYKKALAAYNLEFEEELVAKDSSRGVLETFHEIVESGALSMNNLLNISRPPTAVFATSDLRAIGAMRAIKEKGLRVPQDISIVGFDDLELVRYFEPPLTTLRQGEYQMGFKAAQMLLKLVSKEPISQAKVKIKPTLVIRKSCSCL